MRKASTQDDETARELRVARARLREQAEMLDGARDAIVVHGLDRRIRYWNRGAERMFGYTAAQAVGRSFAELLGPDGALRLDAGDASRELREWSGEVECTTADGRHLHLERHCRVLNDEAGAATGVLSIHFDITEQRRADKEIVLLNNVLEQRIRKRTAELEESNEDLREFAYSLAHDLRAPLASIDGFSAQLEMRLAGQLDEKCRHYLNRVRAGVRRMADLTDALLALADLSNATLMHQAVDLSAIARGFLDQLRDAEPHRDVTLEVRPTPRVHAGDVRLLTSVMENLLANAWKFTSKTPGARIEFGATPRDDGPCVYHVKDNGAGFDPGYAYKLFSPFQRLHRPDEFEGTGIGLAMARKIITRHGGRIWAESGTGGGASFFFTLNENAAV